MIARTRQLIQALRLVEEIAGLSRGEPLAVLFGLIHFVVGLVDDVLDGDLGAQVCLD